MKNRGTKRVDPLGQVMLGLLECFAACDDVFTESDAFQNIRAIKVGFARCYRGWKEARKALDPNFNENRYIPFVKIKMTHWSQSPTDRAPIRPTSSSAPTKTNDLNRLMNGLIELSIAKSPATHAPSDSHA